MFEPMAMTVIIALVAAFVLSIDLRAGPGRDRCDRPESASARTPPCENSRRSTRRA